MKKTGSRTPFGLQINDPQKKSCNARYCILKCLKLTNGFELQIPAAMTLRKCGLDILLTETQDLNKVSKVSIVLNQYRKKKKMEKIKSMKGKLEFTLSADEIRHGKNGKR